MSETREVLRVVCAYCRKVMTEGTPGAKVSHGCCQECHDREMEAIKAYKRGRSLVPAQGQTEAVR